MVTVRSPETSRRRSADLVRYQRPDPHLKHPRNGSGVLLAAGAPQRLRRRAADGADGLISEKLDRKHRLLLRVRCRLAGRRSCTGSPCNSSSTSFTEFRVRHGALVASGHHVVRRRLPLECARRRGRQSGRQRKPPDPGRAHEDNRRRICVGDLGQHLGLTSWPLTGRCLALLRSARLQPLQSVVSRVLVRLAPSVGTLKVLWMK